MCRYKQINVYSKPSVFEKIYKSGNKVAIQFNADHIISGIDDIVTDIRGNYERVWFSPEMKEYCKEYFYIKDGYLYIKGNTKVIVPKICSTYESDGSTEMYFTFYPFCGKYENYLIFSLAYYDENVFKVADYVWEVVED